MSWVGVVATRLVFDGGRAFGRGVARAMSTVVMLRPKLRLVFEMLVVKQTVVSIRMRFGQGALTRHRLSGLLGLFQTRRPRLGASPTHLRSTPT